MKPVRVKLHSYLNVYLPPEQAHRVVELKPGAPVTVAQVVEQLNLPGEEILLVTVNKKRASWETIVRSGDLIELYPVIGGG